jgi:hypothetical protein
MAPAITPYRPINTLKAAAEELWIADGPVIRFSYVGCACRFRPG